MSFDNLKQQKVTTERKAKNEKLFGIVNFCLVV